MGGGGRSVRLFVSHATEDWGSTTESVHEALEASDRDFDVLLDRDRLVKGRDWAPYLHEWMARCDAGLILLTGNALESDWVLKEATILSWRHAMHPTFPLFVARAPGVSRARVSESLFRPLDLGAIQWIGGIEPHLVVGEVENGTAGMGVPTSPFDLMVGKLTDLFGKIGSTSVGVVAGKLNVFREWWPADQEEVRFVEVIARHLLCGDLGEYGRDPDGGPAGVIRGLEGLIGDLGETPHAEVLPKILRILATHWVDGAAAGPLALLPRYTERRAVGLNGRYVLDFTSKVYLTRAHLADASKYYFLPVAGGNDGGFVAHYTSEICRAVQEEPENDWMSGLEEDEVIEELRDMSSSRYVILPDPKPDRTDLGKLLDLFPTINFVLWTGPRLERDPELDRVDWAEPEVDGEVEKREMKDYRASQGAIRRQEAG